jgi:hypothetical protein
MRDSPNGNSYRSDSPDSQSPRERNYQTKSSYLQKIREKERENRDYKAREKYSGKDCLLIIHVVSDCISSAIFKLFFFNYAFEVCNFDSC